MITLGADHCLAFNHNHSPGTTQCTNAARRAGIPTTEHRDPAETED